MRELSLNVMDVAQNSVRAEATLVFITVEESDKNDSLTITIEDNGCGMTEEQVAQVIDPFFTTRTTRKVGLGVPLFKMSAEQTGGSFSIESEVGRGTKTQASYVKSHVDMTPLGTYRTVEADNFTMLRNLADPNATGITNSTGRDAADAAEDYTGFDVFHHADLLDRF
jgi:anti-sigma regulatory factor (Ser/Thr protein kinase)